MTAPIEEAWTAHKDCVVMVDGWRTVFVTHEDTMDERSRERAQLAAAAPEMARALLAVEWSDGDTGPECVHIDGGMPGCPSCGAMKPWLCITHGQHGTGHDADCDLDAALRKAGVR